MEMNEFLKYEEVSDKPTENIENLKKVAEKYEKYLETDIKNDLDKLFPPKSVTKDSEFKKVHVSRTQATSFEIYELTNIFNNKLKELENEETGFSMKLREIYYQLFDELIRQEIIANRNRGLLLVAVRDEALQTMKSMQKLYRSCFAYAITKDLLSRKDIIKKRKEIPKFATEINQANETLQNMRNEWEKAKREKEEKEHIKNIERTYLENQLEIENKQMVTQIEDVIDSEHKWLKDME